MTMLLSLLALIVLAERLFVLARVMRSLFRLLCPMVSRRQEVVSLGEDLAN